MVLLSFSFVLQAAAREGRSPKPKAAHRAAQHNGSFVPPLIVLYISGVLLLLGAVLIIIYAVCKQGTEAEGRNIMIPGPSNIR